MLYEKELRYNQNWVNLRQEDSLSYYPLWSDLYNSLDPFFVCFLSLLISVFPLLLSSFLSLFSLSLFYHLFYFILFSSPLAFLLLFISSHLFSPLLLYSLLLFSTPITYLPSMNASVSESTTGRPPSDRERGPIAVSIRDIVFLDVLVLVPLSR